MLTWPYLSTHKINLYVNWEISDKFLIGITHLLPLKDTMTLHPGPPPPPPQSSRTMQSAKKPRIWPWIVGVVAALGIGGAVGYGGTPEPEIITKEVEIEVEPADMDDRRAELDERDEALTATETQIEENTIPGSGIYLVGEDIKPGTYRSNGSDCYWARLSGTSGESNEIITNNVVEGTAYVTIATSDVAFETSRCGEWTLQ